MTQSAAAREEGVDGRLVGGCVPAAPSCSCKIRNMVASSCISSSRTFSGSEEARRGRTASDRLPLLCGRAGPLLARRGSMHAVWLRGSCSDFCGWCCGWSATTVVLLLPDIQLYGMLISDTRRASLRNEAWVAAGNRLLYGNKATQAGLSLPLWGHGTIKTVALPIPQPRFSDAATFPP